MSKDFSEQELVRRDSLKKLSDLGINSYPAELFDVNNSSQNIKKNFKEGDVLPVSIAGRIMSRRIMGKASFVELQDSHGKIQLYVNRDEMCEGEDKTMYNQVFKRLLDIGDIIGVTGNVFITKVGEISIMVKSLKVLSKSLRPLPLPKTDADGNLFDAFTNPEKRYRQP
jgi:lysyl-tRNA synthetase class 2